MRVHRPEPHHIVILSLQNTLNKHLTALRFSDEIKPEVLRSQSILHISDSQSPRGIFAQHGELLFLSSLTTTDSVASSSLIPSQ